MRHFKINYNNGLIKYIDASDFYRVVYGDDSVEKIISIEQVKDYEKEILLTGGICNESYFAE